jgi:hypothetical protein
LDSNGTTSSVCKFGMAGTVSPHEVAIENNGRPRRCSNIPVRIDQAAPHAKAYIKASGIPGFVDFNRKFQR